MHAWDTATDGPIPIRSSAARAWAPVRLSDVDGEFFGWEKPNGDLVCGVLLVPSTAKQAEIDATHAAALVQLNALDARNTSRAALKTKREAGTSLDAADLDALADLILGV
jgi:hypothetical protein